MRLTPNEVRAIAASPSLSAVVYQAVGLIEELDRINTVEHPPEATTIRDVLLCWAEFIRHQLEDILQREKLPISKLSLQDRICSLARGVQDIFSFIRYLSASSPRQTPPAIQFAVNKLLNLHFPKRNGTPVCVVRPQWKYNLKHIALQTELANLVNYSALDPDRSLGVDAKADPLGALWKWQAARRQGEPYNQDPPRQLAVLSFAGLDTHDSLLYPLLAHEIGHFIANSYSPILSAQVEQVAAAIATRPAVAEHTQDAGEARRVHEALWKRISTCIRELVADAIAVRMMGFGYFVAQAEFLKTVPELTQGMLTNTGHPAMRFRLATMLKHLKDHGFIGSLSLLPKKDPEKEQKLEALLAYLDHWSERLKPPQNGNWCAEYGTKGGLPRVGLELEQIAEMAVSATVDGVYVEAAKAVPDEQAFSLTDEAFSRVECLENDLPPSLYPEVPGCLAEIFTAAWMYQLSMGEAREAREASTEKQLTRYRVTCRLVLKAIELIDVQPPSGPDTVRPEKDDAQGGVLSASHIRCRLALPAADERHLAVVPFTPGAVKGASLDVHLGNWFVVAKRTRFRSFQLGDEAQARLLARVGRDEEYVPVGKHFLIHPGDLVLGATREFLALPKDLMAFVEGRSGLGRLGSIVATASQVAPGFHGVIVLELANAGTVPLEISPGMPIAQLVLQRMSCPVSDADVYRGQYYCQIKP